MKSTTIIVIGGGVIGLSTAYQLARRGAGRIILIEKDQIGEGSSGRAAGIGTHLIWSETGILARRRGFELFRQFSAEWDDYTFHNEHGCLNLFTPEDWPSRVPLVSLYDQMGVPYEQLDVAEIHRRWPALTPQEQMIGLFDPHGGYSEPDEYIPALSRRVRELGVEILEGEAVLDFVRAGDQVQGVRTTHASRHADVVVSTVHAWSLPLWQELGIRLPIKHFVHQRYLTTAMQAPFEAPAVNADPYCGYVRSATGNRILMGVETPLRDEHRVEGWQFRMNELNITDAVRSESQARMADLVPALSNAKWESQKVGLISFSSDGEPVLGPAPGVSGLFLAAAFHSGGFSYNAVVGELIAEWIVRGEPSLDLSLFSPARFTAHETETHLAETLRQNQAVRRRH